ncbi:MAG TPA: glutathione synthase [Polyangiaceae bacterium]|nr:glutathione synthase [Polyangiaceae bacterium]
MRFLFVMDPAEGMLPDKDTSFAFARAALALGHQCLHCLPADVGSDGATVMTRARSLVVSDSAPHVTLGAPDWLDVAELDAVFIRKDPPFDEAYLHLTQVLDLVKDSTLVVNDPRGLRDANEKLFALRFVDWMPTTRVTHDPARILAFVHEHQQAVLKPLDGAGGSGVVLLREGDKNNRALIDLHTREGKQLAMVQAFEPAIERGDKRVLLLDGEPLGAIRRVPRSDDIRANIHVGGRVEATSLTERESALVAAVAPTLRAHGLWFVGLDLIAEKLIEVNVTSPTGIQELGRLGGWTGEGQSAGARPEEQVIRWVEKRVENRVEKRVAEREARGG